MPGTAPEADLARNVANHVALTPLSFLPKAAKIYPNATAIAYGDRRISWADMYGRCRRLASALAQAGVGRGDVVAIMSPNTPAMCEAHFAVPMLGAVLLTLNIRLDSGAIAFQLAHAGAMALITDCEFANVIGQALVALPASQAILVVDIEDRSGQNAMRLGAVEYEDFLASGDRGFSWSPPVDEWDTISLNYTSGTTGDPKGVLVSHRSAYLNAVNNILTADVRPHAAYLWTVPMFHCNGWCFCWTVAAVAGVNVCLRRVEAPAIFDAIRANRVTQMSGAPIVYALLANAPAAHSEGIDWRVTGTIGGSAPPSSLLAATREIQIDLVHIYGLTETLGPAAVCPAQEAWADLNADGRARLVARQGHATLLQEDMTVRDPETMDEVPHDGETIGEIMFRGNITMKGYLRNPSATSACFAGGWFHTGDLGVIEPDGYVRVRDRSKDVIISGGENISSIEVEDVLHRHPAIAAAAVVAASDEKWGETPWAFIELRAGMDAEPEALLAFCRAHLAGYKLPRRFIFGSLPRTSTGKTQKYVLRQRARDMQE